MSTYSAWMLFGWLSVILVIVWISLIYNAVQWRNRCALSLLSEALSCELAHTKGEVDGLLGLYNIPQELTIEEVDIS